MGPPLEHVGLSVSDLERSIEFYTTHFEFEVRLVIDNEPHMGLGEIVGLPGAAARIAHLWSGGFMLELFEYRDPVGRPLSADRTQADKGISHIGFASTDCRGDKQRLEAAGVEFLSEPVEYRADVWVVYFYGPDREVLELREIPQQ